MGRPSKKICQRMKGKESFFTMNDYKNLSQSILREKKKKNPCRVPKSRAETIEYLLNNTNDSFKKKVDQKSDVVMIFNPTILQLLNDKDHVYADGTFQCSPKFFNQMYTFSILDNGYYIPFIFFLVPDKKNIYLCFLFTSSQK